MKSKKIIQFEFSSPKELKEILLNNESEAQFVELSVFGPQILTQRFHFPKSSKKDLEAGLRQDACESLSVKTSDLEISYQITNEDTQGVHGISLAMSRDLLKTYVEIFKKYSLIPVSLKSSSLEGLRNFLDGQPSISENYCLINFLKANTVSVMVFSDGKPAFFRELCDLSEADYKQKITDTIRYTCSRSESKRIERLFFIGDLQGRDLLMKDLKQLESNSENESSVSKGMSCTNITNINLLENLVFNFNERAQHLKLFLVVGWGVFICIIFLLGHIVHVKKEFTQIKSKVNISEYQTAISLQEEIKALTHAQ